ncbi:MAG: hypothetical protein AB8B72_08260 [Crocinitomicaceae bacterium]
MKKIITLFSFLSILSTYSLFSQSVNGVAIADIEAEYIQIVGTQRFLNNKVSIDIDFGQENKVLSIRDTQIRDESGRLVVFNSMIDALNFFSKNGYEFVNAYALHGENQDVFHYILKKKAP